MADRSQQPAALRRRIQALELHLDAERQAHAKTFANYRENLYELVELRLRNERAQAALQGEGD